MGEKALAWLWQRQGKARYDEVVRTQGVEQKWRFNAKSRKMYSMFDIRKEFDVRKKKIQNLCVHPEGYKKGAGQRDRRESRQRGSSDSDAPRLVESVREAKMYKEKNGEVPLLTFTRKL